MRLIPDCVVLLLRDGNTRIRESHQAIERPDDGLHYRGSCIEFGSGRIGLLAFDYQSIVIHSRKHYLARDTGGDIPDSISFQSRTLPSLRAKVKLFGLYQSKSLSFPLCLEPSLVSVGWSRSLG